MQVFAQMTKVDVAKRLVFGIAAQEVADHAGEIMDYEKSKPNFQSWSEGMSKDSNGQNLGNIRAMHSNIAAGKVVEMGFDDAAKSISICAKVVDENEWQKVLEGVYTGFSMGGKYGERWDDGDLKRYEAVPSEISLVDRPCIPTAKFFDIQKVDGSMEKMAFKEPATEKAAEDVEYQVEGSPDDVVALGELLNKHNLTIADAVKALESSLVKDEKTELKKDLYDVGRLSDALLSIYYLTLSAASEATYEGDNSPIPARLKEVAVTVAGILTDMVGEEANELLANLTSLSPDGSNMLMVQAGQTLLKAGARNSKADLQTIQDMHDLTGKLGAACNAPTDSALQGGGDEGTGEINEDSKASGAGKSAPTGNLAKSDLQKAIDEAVKLAIEPMSKALEESQKRVKKLESQPLPARGVLRVVGKAEDVAKISDETVQPIVVLNQDGSINETASMIKKIQQTGGKTAF